ncbi:MAG: Cyanophycinase, partial [uncultured Gemmatimonadetes bacterium]
VDERAIRAGGAAGGDRWRGGEGGRERHGDPHPLRGAGGGERCAHHRVLVAVGRGGGGAGDLPQGLRGAGGGGGDRRAHRGAQRGGRAGAAGGGGPRDGRVLHRRRPAQADGADRGDALLGGDPRPPVPRRADRGRHQRGRGRHERCDADRWQRRGLRAARGRFARPRPGALARHGGGHALQPARPREPPDDGVRPQPAGAGDRDRREHGRGGGAGCALHRAGGERRDGVQRPRHPLQRPPGERRRRAGAHRRAGPRPPARIRLRPADAPAAPAQRRHRAHSRLAHQRREPHRRAGDRRL